MNDDREAVKAAVLQKLYVFFANQDLGSADEVYDVLANALAQFLLVSSHTKAQALYDAKACAKGIEKAVELNWTAMGKKAIKEH